MDCTTTGVYAPNNERSILFEDLTERLKDENAALEAWTSIYTPAFKKVFGDWQSDNFQGNLDENGEPVIDDVLKKEYVEDENIRQQTEKEVEEYQQSIDNVVSKLDKARDIIIRRIKDLEDSKTEGAQKLKRDLIKLKKKLQNKKEALDWKESTLQFTRTAYSSVKFAKRRIESELAKENPNTKILFKMRSQLKAFDVLSQLQGELNANSRLSNALSESDKLHINNVLSLKNEAITKYENFMESRIAEKLSKLSSKEDKKSIEQLLQRAPQDIPSRERWLRFAGDSRDSVIALVAKLVNEQQQKTRHASIEFTNQLTEKLRAMEEERSQFKGNAEKMYEPMLEKDGEGNFTGYMLSEKQNPEQFKAFERAYRGTKTMEFYEFFTEEYKRLNNLLPGYANMGARVPTLLKSTIERVLTGENKLEQIKDHARNSIERTNTDTETGQMLDDTNQPIDSIPLHFTQAYDSAVQQAEYKRLIKNGESIEDARKKSVEYAKKQLAKDVSYDLAASLQSFQYMAENYANMSEIIDVVEGSKDRLYQRQLTVTDAKGDPIISRMKDFEGDTLSDNKQTIQGNESNAYKMIQAFIATQVYGQSEVELGNFNFLNMQVDSRKLLNKLRGYNSYLLMGTNAMAATANVMMGETMQWADAFGGEFYTRKDYLKASKEYGKDIPGIVEDVTERNPKSKVGLVSQYYDFLGDYHPDGVGATDSSGMRRILTNGSLFFLSNMGEHMMQNRAAIAIMLNTKTYDSNGNQIGNLWEAHKAEDGKLKIDDVYIKDKEGNVVKYDNFQVNEISRKTQALLRRMHGNYNKQTAAEWQRNAIMGLVGQFRKWVAEGFDRRWGSNKYNHFMESETEGMYRSFGKFLAGLTNDVFKTKFDVGTSWKDMSNMEKANVKRTAFEVGMFTAMALSLYGLQGMMKDLDEDEDKRLLSFLRFNAYLANRLMTELMFFVWPADTWQILKSPAASMSVLETTGNTLWYALPWNWDEKYESGMRKDQRKVIASLGKQIPIWKQIERMSPDGLKAQLQFFNF